MKYKILRSDCAVELACKIELLLSKGWELHGNLVAAMTFNAYQDGVQYIYAQALIKRS